MIEADRAGILHRGAQHGAKRREVRRDQPNRIEARQSPVLSGRVEQIGRRTDGELAKDRGLVIPCVEPSRINSDRDVEIEPDRQTEPTRLLRTGIELYVRDPLHELMELDLLIVFAAQMRERGIIRHAPLRRPLPPGIALLPAQALEGRKAAELGRA